MHKNKKLKNTHLRVLPALSDSLRKPLRLSDTWKTACKHLILVRYECEISGTAVNEKMKSIMCKPKLLNESEKQSLATKKHMLPLEKMSEDVRAIKIETAYFISDNQLL